MTLKQPETMDECVYFTRRAMNDGKIMCWVFREQCTKCKKGMMSKPLDEKTGKYKVRSDEYLCNSCGYSEPKKEYEEKLVANLIYTCPKCKHNGEAQAPFARKTWQGVKAILFNCGKCKETIPVTKKMKEGKKKGEVETDDDD